MQQVDAAHESFHVVAKRIRRRTLWLQDAARQIEQNGATTARSSVVNHIVEITKADLARLRGLWQGASPDEQAQRGAEYQELSAMLKLGLDCVTKCNSTVLSSASSSAAPPEVVVDVQLEEQRALREIFDDLVGLHELTNELARGVGAAQDELFAMEDSAKHSLLHTERAKQEIAQCAHARNRSRRGLCYLALAALLVLAVLVLFGFNV